MGNFRYGFAHVHSDAFQADGLEAILLFDGTGFGKAGDQSNVLRAKFEVCPRGVVVLFPPTAI
ncbi:MAG: hypothetical protein OEY91_06675, partial [Nitrospirota bacterium]|nr:hypothetical protein [Nitrospirota bacterium]